MCCTRLLDTKKFPYGRIRLWRWRHSFMEAPRRRFARRFFRSSIATRPTCRLDCSRSNGLPERVREKEAFQLLRNTADEFGPSVNAYFLALRLAVDQRDIDELLWSTENLLSHEWSSERDDVHDQTRALVAQAVTDLRANGRTEDADKLQRLSQAARTRDIQVTVHWDGEADIDMSVVEPTQLLCSPLTPRTVGGGVLATDSKGTTERYVAAEAWSGDYEIRIQPIWGKPTGGIANVDIVLHQGTDHERRVRRTVQVNPAGAGDVPLIKITLDNGRRKQPAILSPDRELMYVASKPESEAQARSRLRQHVQNGESAEESPPSARRQPVRGGRPRSGWLRWRRCYCVQSRDQSDSQWNVTHRAGGRLGRSTIRSPSDGPDASEHSKHPECPDDQRQWGSRRGGRLCSVICPYT